MTDEPAIPSPCILVCAIEPESGYCYGCGRTRDEIAGWMTMDNRQKAELTDVLPDRVAGLERRPRRVTRRSRMRGETADRVRSLPQGEES